MVKTKFMNCSVDTKKKPRTEHGSPRIGPPVHHNNSDGEAQKHELQTLLTAEYDFFHCFAIFFSRITPSPLTSCAKPIHAGTSL